MERQDKVVLTLDSYEHGIMIRALNELRNDMLEEQRDPGPVEDVLLKTIDAPAQKDKKAKRRDEARYQDGRPLALCAGTDPGHLVRPSDCAVCFRWACGNYERPACGNEQSIQTDVV